MVGWVRSVYQRVWRRDGGYRILDPRGNYAGVVHSKQELQDYFKQKGWELVVQRNHRTTVPDFLDMFDIYLKWRADFEWEPADSLIHCKTRIARPQLPVVAPCVYALGIEGKEGPFWKTLLDTYDSLSPQATETGDSGVRRRGGIHGGRQNNVRCS